MLGKCLCLQLVGLFRCVHVASYHIPLYCVPHYLILCTNHLLDDGVLSFDLLRVCLLCHLEGGGCAVVSTGPAV